ncbi:Retrovirus-related Pol polyprotein from transposon RE2 [Vitis vinifera]|uniref:Retrovirus-related Pol polyprotein from transposon RE2 n=1 Tax=Vitis vinifera TaxID=29760 RepID=A0A438DN03_VITVI|nr:Retrovirus-related Pol polyprotein from transposon RE2 [Vitis vinifera]
MKASTIRIVLAIAISFQWSLRQLDVQNAFLNGDLDEQVFMAQPHGFMDPQFPFYVCKLNKTLYGLKQVPRAWFHKLSHALLQWGFQASRADSSMFFWYSATDVLILLVYVDDLLVTRSNTPWKQDAPRTLSQHDGPPFLDIKLYRSTVGALQYVILTQPNIAFVVNKAWQFMANPTGTHWLVVKRILRYLKDTSSYGLQLHQANSLDLQGIQMQIGPLAQMTVGVPTVIVFFWTQPNILVIAQTKAGIPQQCRI